MKYTVNILSFFRKSLVAKLILSFVLVSVPPMLLASSVSTKMIQSTVDRNLDAWLEACVGFITDSIESAEGELGAVHGLLLSRFLQKNVTLTESELASLSNLDVDFILLKDKNGKLLYQTGRVKEMDETPLFSGSPLTRITLENGEKEIAVVAKEILHESDGNIRTLALGTRLAISVSDEGKEPIEFRIFLPDHDNFKQVFTSEKNSTFVLQEKTLKALKEKKQKYYISDIEPKEGTPPARSIVFPFRDEQGNIQALYVVSAILFDRDISMPSSDTVFWGFFLLGTFLVSTVGYFVAKRLVLPIKQLTEGVKKVSSGDYSHRVTEEREDEVGELSTGFNLMARQLEIKQTESRQSSRQERSQMLGEIALGFAHEIRNPLVVIKTSAEVVHSKIKGNEKESRLLGFVVEEVRRIDSLISEFLSFAKPVTPVMKYFNLLELAQEIIEISIPEFEKNNILYSLTPPFSFENQNFIALGERNQIRQVILNLILNAISAMPQGGSLSLCVFNENDSVSLSVKDTGIGMSDEVMSTMHIPFTTTKKNGLGLGLAKVYAIIDEHAGSIFCKSEVGEGTTFTITLKGKS